MNQEKEHVVKDILEAGFDLYTRYFLIARLADEVRAKTPMRILDAGGAKGLLRDFLKKDKIVVMDTLPSSTDSVLGDIAHAPFASQSFDLVISIDVYEHIPAGKRADAISEMLRISKKFVILGAPFYSPEVENAEITANDFWVKATGKPHPWLREHLENKLPHENELESLLKKGGYEFYKFGTNNLFMWLILMLFSYYAQRYYIPRDKIGEVWRFYNDNFADLGDFEEPTYRKIYLIGNRGMLPQLNLYKDSRIDRMKRHRLTSLVFDIILEVTAGKFSPIIELETALQEKVAEIHRLESQIYQIQHSIPMRLASRYQRIVERLLCPGTRRHRPYELMLNNIKVILNEGWKSFFQRSGGTSSRQKKQKNRAR